MHSQAASPSPSPASKPASRSPNPRSPSSPNASSSANAHSRARRRKRAARDPETIIRDLGELAIGAPIVHVDHGVGRYQGLLKLDVGGQGGEFLAIEYAKGDKLYVPVSQLHLVRAIPARRRSSRRCIRSAAMRGNAPSARPRRKCATSPPNCSRSTRNARRGQGTALPVRPPMARAVRASFPFEETPDQEQAIEAVIADLASAQGDGSRRLRRRRLRQDRSRAARRVRRRDRRQAGRRARADDAARAAALPEFPRPLRRLAGARRSALALQVEEGNRRGAEEARRRPDRRHDRHAQAAAARRQVQGSRPRHRRRGTALRRAPEGAAEETARRSRSADADRDADPAHAEHGDGGPARSVDHRDAAGAPARGQDLHRASTIPR